jgi:hypothetical protein
MIIISELLVPDFLVAWPLLCMTLLVLEDAKLLACSMLIWNIFVIIKLFPLAPDDLSFVRRCLNTEIVTSGLLFSCYFIASLVSTYPVLELLCYMIV